MSEATPRTVVCGFCGRAPEEHGDSDAGPMSVCPAGDSVHIDPQPLIEKAAEAMFCREGEEGDWDSREDNTTGYYMRIARVALEAAGVPALLTQLAETNAQLIGSRVANGMLRGELESLRTALRDLMAAIDENWLYEPVHAAYEDARAALSGVPEPPEET